MIKSHLSKYKPRFGVFTISNPLHTSMSRVTEKNHYLYLLEETKTLLSTNQRHYQKGLDIKGYKYAKFSWRHKILKKARMGLGLPK